MSTANLVETAPIATVAPDAPPEPAPVPTPETPAPMGRAGKLPYLPGLDGLRAVSVLAVLLYHAGAGWLPGGFLGVEVFFAISGYLITALLLAEWQETGRVKIGAFWLRRAGRLLPALFAVLVATLAYAALFAPDELARLRGDTLAALVYATNWYLITAQESYFAGFGRPSALRHLWSLAVEEQFYLLWPPLLAAVLWLFRRRGVLLVALAGAVASALLMAEGYAPGADPSRLYYGTDTRLTGLLLGAALACVWAPWRLPRWPAWGRRTARAFDALGLAATVALVACFAALTEVTPTLYRGGFALVAVATVALIAALAHPRARVGAAFGWGPLRWLGTRSYGVYLWHWPVFVFTRPGLDLPLDGPPLLALRLAVTLALAEVSYRLVETPVRRGAIGRAWAAWRAARGQRRRTLAARWLATATVGVFGIALLGAATVTARPAAPSLPFSVTAVRIVATPLGGTVSPAIAAAATAAAPIASPIAAAAILAPPVPTPAPVLVPSGTPTATAVPPTAVPTEVPAPTPPPATATALMVTPLAALTPHAMVAPPQSMPPAPMPHATTVAAAAAPMMAAAATPAPMMAITAPSTVTPVPTARPTMPPTATPPPVPTATPAPTAATTAVPMVAAAPTRVTAIGDSVMVGASPSLVAALPSIEIEAAVSVQATNAVELLRRKGEAGELGDVVIVHVGTNGTFTARQLDEMMAILGERRVFFVNVKVPRPWEGPNNAMLAENVPRYPNAALIDWHAAITAQPALLWTDGVHLRPEGNVRYAELIVARVQGG